jgi:hypothetical protein
MKSFNFKLTTRLLAVALVIIICLPLTDSCADPPERQLIENDKKELPDSVQSDKRFQDSIIKLLAARDSALWQIRRVAGLKEKELQVSKSTALRLRNELRGYRSMDTGTVYAKIDSLLAENESLAYLLSQYLVAYESLSDSVEKRD